ncbi:PspA/IM30 family protein [Aliikangiella sp. G2MR2-5]|uniref:PspA/IM30 family protein n=1 Tax=Aliikangiella sp. G2MR2-5 TaxID=2788943 RepID=UPI0018AC1FC4|nr:PspA/IM30 family protein [Aliikangiella sp. G2MR2-5]
MNIITKLLTAIRGGAREIGEAVVDTQSLRIFEQEIHDSKANLAEAKQGLTEIVAKKMAAERQLKEVQEQIAENENYAIKALEKNDETLALEIATKIASLESKAETQKIDLATYEKNADLLKSQIQEAEKIIADHERELAIVKTRNSVHQATKSVTQTITANESSIGSARESLERIKQKQQAEEDKLQAGVALKKEMEGDSLEQKLKASGIKQEKHSAEAVLARLKSK